ncbi:unnamed protein product [Allacma fusca]|uniref:Pyridoxine-5'-phosphate oxidase n=1 Tax=Allacma fusca TaxID=39272 RepID=A0A8J2PDG2_9HEXA|nr:unnamed protein product [Allacma fusca]
MATSASTHVFLGGMRTPYRGKEDVFTEDKLIATEPITQFDHWFQLASSTAGIIEPNAMCLATASKEGRPSARMVLLKGYGADGFKFFTNYDSRKGKEIAENPFGAINFFWEPLKRCVRIEGVIEKLEEQEAQEYFNSRPVSSRIGAALSLQSQPIPSREYLDQKEKELQELADAGIPIEKPKYW